MEKNFSKLTPATLLAVAATAFGVIPPTTTVGGGNRPRPPSPFSSSGKDKDWNHLPMIVVEEEWITAIAVTMTTISIAARD